MALVPLVSGCVQAVLPSASGCLSPAQLCPTIDRPAERVKLANGHPVVACKVSPEVTTIIRCVGGCNSILGSHCLKEPGAPAGSTLGGCERQRGRPARPGRRPEQRPDAPQIRPCHGHVVLRFHGMPLSYQDHPPPFIAVCSSDAATRCRSAVVGGPKCRRFARRVGDDAHECRCRCTME